MSRDEIGAAFDEISRVYDATRDPPEAAMVERIVRELRRTGVDRVLEVGVGTGRMAVPLERHGLEVTGADVSRGMLRAARAKGLERLVRGSAYALPFAEGSFDLVLFAHLLHLLDRPAEALREGDRVARLGVAALVDAGPTTGSEAARDSAAEPQQLVFRLLGQEGVKLPERAHGPRFRDRLVLRTFPPDRLVVVSERDVTERFDRTLDLLERRASRWTLHVPEDALRRAVAEARRTYGDRTYRYHRVRALAFWPPRGS